MTVEKTRKNPPTVMGTEDPRTGQSQTLTTDKDGRGLVTVLRRVERVRPPRT